MAEPQLPPVALQLIVYVPACTKLGTPVKVMLGFRVGPAHADGGKKGALFVWQRVSGSASGLLAEAVTETREPGIPLTLKGAVINGPGPVHA